ncbi:MAG: T9SS type A sorting domain-containing protein [Saprospiraceae bacterium]|nr:T9SS type A sorting domain-containing protein [Saprospiraceae bacterium]
MKRLLLLLLTITLCLFDLHAQTVIWEEDFDDGMRGWSTRTDQCGRNFGGVVGSYELTSITVDGNAVTGVTAEFNIMNSLEYNVNFDDGTNYGTIYGRYTLANDIMDSNLDAASVPINGKSASLDANNFTITSTVLEVTQEVFDDWASVLSGIADPTAVLDGSVLTLSSGNTVITLTNRNVCAGLFYYSSDGSYGTIATVPTVIGSATATNGFVFLNTIMQTWLEDNANIPNDPSEYPEYTASIISPEIDISTAQRALALEFTQAVRFLNFSAGGPTIPINETVSRPVNTALEISTDGGVNWSVPIQLNERINPNEWFETRESIPLPAAVIGDATSIRIRMTFGSDFYFWGFDDLRIIERPAYDMQVNDNFFAVYPNLFTPISQADTAVFLADIQNNGGLNAPNVVLDLSITSDEDGTEIYRDSVEYGNIIVDSLAENQLFNNILFPEDLAPGIYTGSYVIRHDSLESVTNNDTIRFQFVLNDSVFQKEAGFLFGDASGTTPADDVSFTFGNIFYCPNGEGYVATNISFGVANADELAGRSVTTYLYAWEDANDDGIAQASEYGDALALNTYQFTGDESDEELITIPFDFEGTPIPLENNTSYLALVQYINSSDNQDLEILVSNRTDYNATSFAYAQAGLRPRYTLVLNVGPDPSPDLSTAGFGQDVVPMIRMSIAQTVDAPDVLGEENLVKIYPNPTNGIVNLEVELEKMADRAEISVIDATGRILQRNQYQGFKAGRFNYDLSNLSAGFYFIRLHTEQGIRTEKIFLQR